MISRELRTRVLRMFDGHCAYCGRLDEDEDFGSRLTIEHILPSSKGGTDDEDNLLPICSRCNSRKSAKSLLAYREYLETRGEDLVLDRVLAGSSWPAEVLINMYLAHLDNVATHASASVDGITPTGEIVGLVEAYCAWCRAEFGDSAEEAIQTFYEEYVSMFGETSNAT